MIVPDFLYQLSQQGAGTPLLQAVEVRAVTNGAAVSVDAPVFEVPADRTLFVTHLVTRCNPGAAIICNSALVYYQRDGSVFQSELLADFETRVANENLSINLPMMTIVRGGVTIRHNAGFSAATDTNQIVTSLFGVLIPTSNITSGGST